MAPGYRADLVLLDDLEQVAVAQVVCGGRLVEPDLFAGRSHPRPIGYGSVRRGPVGRRRSRRPRRRRPDTPVIGARPFSLLTDHLSFGESSGAPLKLAVLERHGRNGNIGRGWVTGFGPLRGAIASSIGHDSHNLIVAGDNDGRHGGGGEPPDRAAGRGRGGAVTARSWPICRCRWPG